MQKHSRRYQITYEVLNAVTHGFGFLLAMAAGILLLVQAGRQAPTALEWAALIFYVASIALFLLASTLFHALVFTPAARLFQILDHAGIYLVILGSYTPYTWCVLQPAWGWSIWAAIAVLTVAGLIYDFYFVGRYPWLSVLIYLVMGWLIIIAMPLLWTALTPAAFYLLLAGGITYSLGTIFYLVPQIPMGHVYWHLMVLLGAGLMFLSIYQTFM
ncbi:hemolysin III family protein [Leuconostocaceae bacterium ESL0958]|nr:hemolysin III family protein [Leuconostocaceae bacterium ESL0958]